MDELEAKFTFPPHPSPPFLLPPPPKQQQQEGRKKLKNKANLNGFL